MNKDRSVTDIGPKTDPADTLYALVRSLVQEFLTVHMKETEVATRLNVSNAQAKIWLQRLVSEGIVEKRKKPAGYVIRDATLFK